jgi:hypothetical protein
MLTWDFSQPWYHGSPHLLDTLLPGSTITQDEALARVFSHKPGIVCLEDDPAVLARGVPRLRHNGSLPGLLYLIAERLSERDIYPHPRSSLPPGLEWLTSRPLKLRLVGPVQPVPGEFLTPVDVTALLSRLG